jgi:CYTH domain-containing protein
MEIERKFLINNEFNIDTMKHFNCTLIRTTRITQYYLSILPEIRFRRSIRGEGWDSYRITFKSGYGLVRQEKEWKITKLEFENNIDRAVGIQLEKMRYTYVDDNTGLIYEVDDYINFPLKVIEIEFDTEEKALWFVPPEYFGVEVTYDEKYKNKNIALNGGV